jgi:heterodisulfide reductase subunit B
MKFAFFLGCTIPYHLKAYEISSRAILNALGITLVDIPSFGCCGYPLKNTDLKASLLSTARNLALAEKEELPILALCKCGYGTFKLGAHALQQNPDLKKELNGLLAEEGLCFNGTQPVSHFLTVLHQHVGLEKIKDQVVTPLKDLRIATHYGCHALRPSDVVAFDDPVSPTVFDNLVSATGATSIAWPEKLDCCGGPLAGIHDTFSAQLAESKIASAKREGAHFIATACPFCHIQFNAAQKEQEQSTGDLSSHTEPGPLLYSQLLGYGMGLDLETLGLTNGDRHKLSNLANGH